MAEFLVPAVGLGFLWIISNQKKEGYTNIQKGELGNSGLIPKNYSKKFYPINLNNQSIEKNLKNNTRVYKSQKDETKKYYDSTFQQKQNEINYPNNDFESLTGQTVNSKDLTHNNMVPWFGSRIRQPLETNKVSENILDSYTGSGSQHNHKKVLAPMFEPQKNMHYTNGTPNTNDWMQSRMNVSQKISGVKPFGDVKVGPGLNRGYTSESYGGFNAGMSARDQWMPKNVDELRVKTNPKQSYKGQILGAKASVQSRGIMGSIEKRRPDTHYENCPDRWFTTTGIEKAQTQRAEELLKYENREDTSTSYYGAGRDPNNNKPYVKPNYLPDKRQDLPTDPIGVASRANVWDSDKNDYGREGFTALPNSRSLTGQTNTMGNIGRGMWALATPVLDTLRPSRKTNVIGNLRPIGNAKGPQEQKLYNRHQTPKSTIKEQYSENRYVPMGKHPHEGGYAVANIELKGQQRTSTQYSHFSNPSSSSLNSKPKNYEMYENQRVNNKDLLSVNRTNPGNMKLVNNNVNVNVRKEPLICGRQFNSPNMPVETPNLTTIGQQSYKVTRGQFGNYDRADPNMVSALSNNPYAQSLNSVA
tara:strand:+ start:1098 stop:2858 length:1761 start_codon:yes stop_codon:yes gene_type:complete